MLFTNLYKILVKKVTFVGLGGRSPSPESSPAVNSLLISVSRWNSWLEQFRFHVNCIHFRGAVFVHVRLAQLCTGKGVSFHMCNAVEVARLLDKAVAYTCVI